MQKLVWQNANGVELDLTSGNYGITEWEGFSNASLNIQSQQVPFQDGGVFLDALIEQRELSVTLAMQDNNNLELRYQQRRELISALNPKLGEGYLIYTNDYTSKRIKCVAQIPLFETHNSDTVGTPKASLSWTACEPYWEDVEDTVVVIGGGTKSTTIVNNGDVPVSPVFYTKEANRIMIENQKGEKIVLESNYAMPALTIDTREGKKSVAGNGIFSLEGKPYTINNADYSIVGNITKANDTYYSYSEYSDNEIRKAIVVKSKDLLSWEQVGEEINTSGTGIGTDYIRNICYNKYQGTLILLQNETIRTSTDFGLTWTTEDNTEYYYSMCINEKTGETYFSTTYCMYNPLTQEIAELQDNSLIIHREEGDKTVTLENGNYNVYVDSNNNYIVYDTQSSYNEKYYLVDCFGNILKQVSEYGVYVLFETEYGYYGIGYVPYVGNVDYVNYIPKDFSSIEYGVQFFPHHTICSVVEGIPIITELETPVIYPTILSNNYISCLSNDSNLNMKLSVGQNNLVTQSMIGMTVKFRQKYIGV